MSQYRKIIMPLPSKDFDPTEAAVPFLYLSDRKIEVTIATPNGLVPQCDFRMLTGEGLGPFKKILRADYNGQQAYLKMTHSKQFNEPILWSDIRTMDYDGIILPGGHAQGMKEYLESSILQNVVADFFLQKKWVGAICHGVVLAARSRNLHTNHSVLYGYKTTALLKSQEYLAWILTYLRLKNYYRTYPQSVEDEVKSQLEKPEHFIKGPLPLRRDSIKAFYHGFVVCDRNYISARWPGDAHKFAQSFYVHLVTSIK